MDPIAAAIAEAIRPIVREELAALGRQQGVDRRLLRVKDVAAMIGLSERSVRELIDRGEIPTRDVEPYNCILVARSDLDAWVDALPSRRARDDQKTA